MRLTTYTDYALRVLIYAALKEGELVRIDEVARRFGISRNHLTKVVHNLGTRRYLHTVRGRNGGFRLARDAVDIRVGQVVRDFEPDFDLVECFRSYRTGCRIDGSCALAGVLDTALAAFLEHLDGVSVADLLTPRHGLLRQLGLPATGPSQPGR